MSWELQGDLREANEEIAELKALLAKETARADAEAKVVDWYAEISTTMTSEEGLFFRDGLNGNFEPFRQRARARQQQRKEV